MKPSALKVFVCPRCTGRLCPTVDHWDGEEVIEGALACVACTATYPITRGVPRFVSNGDYASSFGRQWNWFRTVQIDSHNRSRDSERTLRQTTGWSDSDLRGRMALDAGVGAGRFAECVARAGATVFGVDLTPAVDAAFANIGHHPNVHLAQADIFSLPFRPGTFDLAYSIGVLHHTPEPERAFGCVARAVRSGGEFAVYLYNRYGAWHKFSDGIRVVTTRLPSTFMRVAATAAVPLYYLYKIPGVGRLFQLLAPISLEKDWRWRWLDTFDWYTPRYQFKYLYPEVDHWFRDNGFGDVRIFDGAIRMRGTKLQHADALDERYGLVAS